MEETKEKGNRKGKFFLSVDLQSTAYSCKMPSIHPIQGYNTKTILHSKTLSGSPFKISDKTKQCTFWIYNTPKAFIRDLLLINNRFNYENGTRGINSIDTCVTLTATYTSVCSEEVVDAFSKSQGK